MKIAIWTRRESKHEIRITHNEDYLITIKKHLIGVIPGCDESVKYVMPQSCVSLFCLWTSSWKTEVMQLNTFMISDWMLQNSY